MWKEEEHPRDKDGKFTFKNGDRNNSNKQVFKLGAQKNVYGEKSPAETLFKNAAIQKEIEKQKQEKRKNFLIFRVPAQHKQIFYTAVKNP